MAASSLIDVCRFNPTLGGTTDCIVSTAATGYQTPASANAVNGAQYSYRAESADLSQWEVGIGTYTVSTTTLTRATVLFNSSGGTSKISFSTVPTVAIVALKEDLKVAPTHQVFTSSSGTYTTPASCLYIRVRMVGAGGAGGNSGPGAASGNAGGNTTFGTSLLAANGGSGGGGSTGGSTSGGAGGTASGGTINLGGSPGGNGQSAFPGGPGGASPLFNGAGQGGIAGVVLPSIGVTNTGGGGGGGGGPGGSSAGAGGGSGGYVEAVISSPAATYAYAVGAGGTAGSGGTTQIGAVGGSGYIIVEEFYN